MLSMRCSNGVIGQLLRRLSDTNLTQPFRKIIVIAHPANFSSAKIKKRAPRQVVGLPVGRRKTLVLGHIRSVNHILCSRMRAIAADGNANLGNALAVAQIHAGKKRGKKWFTNLPGALIQLMDDIFGQELQKTAPLSAVKSMVIVVDELVGRLGRWRKTAQSW